MFKYLSASSVVLLVISLVSGCEKATEGIVNSDHENRLSTLEVRLSELDTQNRYLTDYIEIWRVQSLYQHYINIGARQDIVALFADSEDVEIELSNKGIVRGADAPQRYFLRSGQKRDPDAPPPRPIPGFMVMHMSVNPAIEINSDGSKAKAVWLSPGITNLYREGKMRAGWNFGKYAMDYIKQDGQWKILSFRWHQIFLTPYDKGWVEENLDPGSLGSPVVPDKPSAPEFYNPYRADKANRFDPPPPQPFQD